MSAQEELKSWCSDHGYHEYNAWDLTIWKAASCLYRTEIERLKVIDRRTADSNREFCEQLYIANGEIERLKNELSATQAREAMLVDALKIISTCQHDEYNQMVYQAQDALSNSAEHTEKWLAEVKAKAVEEYIKQQRDCIVPKQA